MKRLLKKRLVLGLHTIKQLTIEDLEQVGGGITGLNCTAGCTETFSGPTWCSPSCIGCPHTLTNC